MLRALALALDFPRYGIQLGPMIGLEANGQDFAQIHLAGWLAVVCVCGTLPVLSVGDHRNAQLADFGDALLRRGTAKAQGCCGLVPKNIMDWRHWRDSRSSRHCQLQHRM